MFRRIALRNPASPTRPSIQNGELLLDTTSPRPRLITKRGGALHYIESGVPEGTPVNAVAAALATALAGGNNDLVFTAKVKGTSGEAITIAYDDPDEANAALSVDVEDSAIVVHLANGGAVAAALVTALAGADNDLIFTAKQAGAAGNDIAVEYRDPNAANAVLSVEVVDGVIVVHLENDGGVLASLETAFAGGNNDIVFTAKAGGEAGNDVSLAFLDPGAASEALTVDANGNAITVNLATSAPVAATLPTALAGGNNDLLFTAKAAGIGGNGLSVKYTDPGAANVLSVDVVGDAIEVLLGHDGVGITSTATQVKAAIDADPEASLLVDVANADGNDGSGIVAAMVETPLANGDDGGAIISTATEVKAALEADPATNALVTIAMANGNNGSGVVEAMPATNLAGGDNGVIVTLAAQIKTAIEANADANALVAVANAPDNNGTGVVTALPATNLAGGDNGVVTTTAAQVKAAIEASVPARALVAVALAANNNGTGIVAAMGARPLADGVDGTVAVEGDVYRDNEYLYVAIADNTVADTNWRRIALGEAY